jgi:TRAP transporter TAXI family solute receptor
MSTRLGHRRARVICIGYISFACVSFAALRASSQDSSQDTPQDCRQLSENSGPRLATGLANGSYFRFATQLKELNKQSLERFQVCTTQGTIENLQLLSQGNVEFAIVQGDVMHEGWSGDQPQEQEKKLLKDIAFQNLALVRLLFSEKMHIVARPHSYVSTVGDLKSKNVWLGSAGSGTRSTAMELLRAAGVENFKEKAAIKDYREANKKLLNGELDAFFQVTTVPVDENVEVIKSQDVYEGTLTYLFDKNDEVRLVNLDPSLLERILQSPAYLQVPIYRKTYPGQRDGIMTIGIEAMLIARDERMPGHLPASDAEVKQLNDAINNSSSEIGKRTNIDLDLLGMRLDPKGDSVERALAAHAHPAARKILLLDPKKRYYVAGFAGVIGVLLLLLAFRSKKALETLGGNTKFIVNGGLLAAACGLFGVALWYYEGRFSFSFHNPLAAAQSLLVYFARGLKTETLMTQQGQMIALVALAVIATLVHSINSDALDEGVGSGSKKLARWFYRHAASLRPDERHFVILNWDQRASEKVAEWMKDPVNAKSKITIVSPQLADVTGTPQSEKIEILQGDPKALAMLEKARVQDAKLVLVCSLWTRSDPFDRRRGMDVELADNYTIRAIHAIRALESRNHSKHTVPVDAEIYLESNRQAAHNAGGSATEIKAPRFVPPGFVKIAQGGTGQTPPLH